MRDRNTACPGTADDSAGADREARPGARLIAGSLDELSEHYFDLLALAWRRRNQQLASYGHGFDDLTAWDTRLRAYIEALVLLKRQACPQGLERLNHALTEAELFALTLLALATRDGPLTRACIGLVQGMPHFIDAYAAALTWASWSACRDGLALWPKDDAGHRQLYLHALAHHDVGLSPQRIKHWVEGLPPQPRVRIAALRCAVLRDEAEWAGQARRWLETPHPALRLAAAEALMVFGPAGLRPTMLPLLRDLALDPAHPVVGENAARKLLTLPCTEAQELLEALAADPDRQRLYLQSMGWAGDPQAVPPLSERLDDPLNARLAASVIGMLTGAHPVRDGWQAAEPPSTTPPAAATQADDAMPPPDPDAGLPWPDRSLFSSWWQNRCDDWPADQRYLGGRPRTRAELLGILQHGVLAWRPQAAWRLQIVYRGPRFPWRASAQRQHRHLATFTETLNG